MKKPTVNAMAKRVAKLISERFLATTGCVPGTKGATYSTIIPSNKVTLPIDNDYSVPPNAIMFENGTIILYIGGAQTYVGSVKLGFNHTANDAAEVLFNFDLITEAELHAFKGWVDRYFVEREGRERLPSLKVQALAFGYELTPIKKKGEN